MSEQTQDWTYEEVRGTIIHHIERHGKPFVNLEVFHASEDNIKNIIAWTAVMGYNAQYNKTSACVTITKGIK